MIRRDMTIRLGPKLRFYVSFFHGENQDGVRMFEVHTLFKDGDGPGYHLGRGWNVPEAALEALQEYAATCYTGIDGGDQTHLKGD